MSGRGRRTRLHGPSGIPTVAEPRPKESDDDGTAASVAQPVLDEVDEAPPTAQAETAQPAHIPRSRARAIQPRPIETYFGKEMLHIGIAAVVVFGVLAVAAVFLF